MKLGTDTGEQKFGLTNNQLKLIAMISMCIDHVGLQLFPDVILFRIVGRLAFPVFAYMIAEGCFYTKNRLRYFMQLFALGMGCQIVFFVATRDLHQGILITFSMSVAVILAIERFRKQKNVGTVLLMAFLMAAVMFVSLVLPFLIQDSGFRVDYGFLGVLLPVLVYYSGNKIEKLFCTASVLLVMCAFDGGIQWFSLLTVSLLLLYNGTRGSAKLKYVFYVFYPAHLAMIYLIGVLIQLLSVTD